MSASAAARFDLDLGTAARSVGILGGLLFLQGLLQSESIEQFLAFFLVAAAALMPSVLWIRRGAPEIPVLPTIALAYVPYYAWPILSGAESMLNYSFAEILGAAMVVAGFLLLTTAGWQVILLGYAAESRVATENVKTDQVVRLVVFGLTAGLAFHLANATGLLYSLGSYYGLVRTIANTFVVLACFLVGVMRAQGSLRGAPFFASLFVVLILVALSWSSLLMVGGIVYGLALALGYVIVAKRIPWLPLAAALLVVSVFHAGKAEMRAKYWAADSTETFSLDRAPQILVEWVGEGLAAVASGDTGQSIVERTSLLQMVLLAQTSTPDRVDYLMGETYALLPAILVPRFVESEKPASQVGMELLNVRYGLLTATETETTAIGWGLIAEAYANFGYFGVAGMALVFGAYCALLGVWSGRSTEVVSLANLFSVASMMGLLGLELDFIQLFSSLLQAFAVVALFYFAYRSIALR